VYAFFRPVPDIEYVDGHRCHIFQCAAKSCKQKLRGVRRYLDKGDANSTSNMHKHAKRCWGDDIVASADQAKNVNQVHATTVKRILDPQSITAAFERQGKGKVTYSHRQHTKTKSRAEIVQWVAESKRPFSMASNQASL
jgi:hypothetical protein